MNKRRLLSIIVCLLVFLSAQAQTTSQKDFLTIKEAMDIVSYRLCHPMTYHNNEYDNYIKNKIKSHGYIEKAFLGDGIGTCSFWQYVKGGHVIITTDQDFIPDDKQRASTVAVIDCEGVDGNGGDDLAISVELSVFSERSWAILMRQMQDIGFEFTNSIDDWNVYCWRIYEIKVQKMSQHGYNRWEFDIRLTKPMESITYSSDENGYSLSGIAKTLSKYRIAYLENFKYGLAKIGVEQGDKIFVGLINKKGEVVLPFRYQKIGEYGEKGLIAVADIHFKWGYADRKGNVIIPCQYKDIGSRGIGVFSEGKAAVCLDDNTTCYINEQGEMVIPPFEAYRAGDYHGELAPVEFNKKETSFINKKGEVVVPPSRGRCKNYTEGLFFVVGHDGGWLMNNKGKMIIPKQGWTLSGVFSDGLMGFNKIGERRCGFIDVTGQIAIPAQFDEEGIFSEGLAAVKLNNKWGFINTNGKIVIPCQFDNVGISYYNKRFCEGYAPVFLNGKWGFINKEGRIVIPCQYERSAEFHEGFCVVWSNNQIGVIDRQGKLVIPFGKYQYISDFSEGLSSIERNGRKGYLDKNGRCSLDY